MLKPGDDVDSWCGVCKRILAHTIEAMVEETPARLICNTCKAKHKYKPNEPGTRKRAAAGTGTKTRKPRVNQYEKLLEGQDMSLAKVYSTSDSYVEGDVLNHKNFGVGFTTTVKAGSKIEVIFQDGMKTLVHER
jgi:hypothetical protein